MAQGTTKVLLTNGQLKTVNEWELSRIPHEDIVGGATMYATAMYEILISGDDPLSPEDAAKIVRANVSNDLIAGLTFAHEGERLAVVDGADDRIVDRVVDGIDPTIPTPPPGMDEPYVPEQWRGAAMPETERTWFDELARTQSAREQALAESNWQAFNRFMTQTAGGMTPLARGYLQRQYEPLRMGYLTDPTISPYTTFSDFLQSGRAPLGPQGGIDRLRQIQSSRDVAYTPEQIRQFEEARSKGQRIEGFARGPQLAAMFGGPQGQQLAFDVALQPMLSQVAPSFRASFEQAAGDVFNRFLNQTPQKSFMDQLIAKGGIFGPTMPQTTSFAL